MRCVRGVGKRGVQGVPAQRAGEGKGKAAGEEIQHSLAPAACRPMPREVSRRQARAARVTLQLLSRVSCSTPLLSCMRAATRVACST